MSALINTVNTADRIAKFWRHGNMPSISAQERLVELGFYAVVVGERNIVAWLNGYRFEL